MIKIDKPIIVEGKYDKITLENVVDGLILPTKGFGIFKDAEIRELIRRLGKAKGGLIVMTDSDRAGNMIRAFLKNIAGDIPVTQVYLPQQKGKERRKAKPSKEGYLGLEGLSPEILTECLERYGVTGKTVPKKEQKITKTDLYCAGLSGRENSKENRKKLAAFTGLPDNLSPNALLDVLNGLYTKEEFSEVWNRCFTKEKKELSLPF